MECKTSEPPSSMDSCSGEPPPAALSTASSGYRPAIRETSARIFTSGLASRAPSVQTDRSAPSTPRSALTTTATATAPKTAVAYQRGSGGHGPRSLFVKVYMEGVPIGRKLDLLLLDGYDGLLAQLGRMFKASITYPDAVGGHLQAVLGEKQLQQARHVLTYEDQEGTG